MINEYQFRATPEQAYDEEHVKQLIAREKGLDIRTLNAVRILKKSIDAHIVLFSSTSKSVPTLMKIHMMSHSLQRTILL